jgi:hypothetical protein
VMEKDGGMQCQVQMEVMVGWLQEECQPIQAEKASGNLAGVRPWTVKQQAADTLLLRSIKRSEVVRCMNKGKSTSMPDREEAIPKKVFTRLLNTRDEDARGERDIASVFTLVFNFQMRHGIWLDSYTKATKIMIPKPGKRPEQYKTRDGWRDICLLAVKRKLVMGVATARTQTWMEMSHAWGDVQLAGRKDKLPALLIAHLRVEVCLALAKTGKQQCIVVMLDEKSCFPRTVCLSAEVQAKGDHMDAVIDSLR